MNVESSEGSKPLDETSPEPTLPGEVPHWSARAEQRLTRARLWGLLSVVIGAVLFIVGVQRNSLVNSLAESSGLTLLVAGLIVIGAVGRTRHLTPDQPFIPRPITNPRMWFVLTWGSGVAVAVMLLFLDLAKVPEQLIMLAFALSLMFAGSMWLLRWISGRRAKLWPAHTQIVPHWVPAWTVIWATVWGVVSTLLAIVLEALPFVALGLLAGTAFKEVPSTRLTSFEGLEQVVRDPLRLTLVFLGACIGAPLVEEAAKALGLRGLRRWILSPADGWLLGFASGIGFGMLEGAFFLDSAQVWFTGGWMRLVALLLHGLATSLTGLGYARYLQSGNRAELRRGYLRAVTMHGLWNGCAFAIAFAGVALGLSALALNLFLVCLIGVLIVGAIILMVMLIRSVAQATVQTSIQEDYQQARVALPSSWSPMKFNLGWRLVGRAPVFVPKDVTPPHEDLSRPPGENDSPQ